MKPISYLIALLLLITNVSCTKNNDESTENKGINGKWNLKTISTFIAGSNYTFPDGQITWTFNSTTSTVTVLNNSAITEFNLPSGVYNYTIAPNSPDNGAPCSEYLTIEGGHFGCIVIENGKLSLNSSNPDGINYTLTSN
jgi:hypothetical protein